MEIKMQAKYYLHTNGLTNNFLDSIKQTFKHKNIEVPINDENKEEFEIKQPFIVSSMDEARLRVAIARASSDDVSEEEYKKCFVF